YIVDILHITGDHPVSLEVVGTTVQEMVAEGKKLFELFGKEGNINVKIPVNPTTEKDGPNSLDGIHAIKELHKMGIPVNCTLIFTPAQALLAAHAGAEFYSPFAGRIDDYLREVGLGWKPVSADPQSGQFTKSDYFPAVGYIRRGERISDNGVVSGVDLALQCRLLLSSYGLSSKMIFASTRNFDQMVEAEMAGADIATLPLEVMMQLQRAERLYNKEGIPKSRVQPHFTRLNLDDLPDRRLKAMVYHPKTCEGMQGFIKDASLVPAYRKLLYS
ncbi:hypothetical protein HYX12_01395, partial [Candidatus Woesearchaeota archaeon]|nr:hypothetical protein [Candidatus Woesearchaeota archaeon]